MNDSSKPAPTEAQMAEVKRRLRADWYVHDRTFKDVGSKIDPAILRRVVKVISTESEPDPEGAPPGGED